MLTLIRQHPRSLAFLTGILLTLALEAVLRPDVWADFVGNSI